MKACYTSPKRSQTSPVQEHSHDCLEYWRNLQDSLTGQSQTTRSPWRYVLPDRSRAMPPVRTLLFLVPLVKALRPRTTPAKQLSTASSMKARVASQKAGDKRRSEAHAHQHIYWWLDLPGMLGFFFFFFCTHVNLLVSSQQFKLTRSGNGTKSHCC